MTIKRRTPDRLLEEAYLFILTRRPAESDLLKCLRIRRQELRGVLRGLSQVLKKRGLKVVAVRREGRRSFNITANAESDSKPVSMTPDSLGAMPTPPFRRGLKAEDEIVYARDW